LAATGTGDDDENDEFDAIDTLDSAPVPAGGLSCVDRNNFSGVVSYVS
jgi:hypothetical protein